MKTHETMKRRDFVKAGTAAVAGALLASSSPASVTPLERLRYAIVGTGPQVASKLRALADTLEVQELVVITWAHDPAARRRSYELLAEELLP